MRKSRLKVICGRSNHTPTLIESGISTSTVHVGPTPFMGVEVESAERYGSSGAIIAGLVQGGPAANAGLQTGDVITKIDGTTITTPKTITKIVLTKKPGDKLSVTYRDRSGVTRTANITLGSGPAQ